MDNMKYVEISLQVQYDESQSSIVFLWGRFYLLCANIHWHVSTVVYNWGHLADSKVSQFIKEQKIHFGTNMPVSPTFWQKNNICH
jgi:hypothetical protein